MNDSHFSDLVQPQKKIPGFPGIGICSDNCSAFAFSFNLVRICAVLNGKLAAADLNACACNISRIITEQEEREAEEKARRKREEEERKRLEEEERLKEEERKRKEEEERIRKENSWFNKLRKKITKFGEDMVSDE